MTGNLPGRGDTGRADPVASENPPVDRHFTVVAVDLSDGESITNWVEAPDHYGAIVEFFKHFDYMVVVDVFDGHLESIKPRRAIRRGDV